MARFVAEELWSDRAKIREVQSSRLLEQLALVSASNPFWKKRFAEAGVDASTIRSVDDLPRLPITTKQQLVDDQAAHPPYGTNLTYPVSEYKRLHQTSGTSGSPLRCPDTLENWEWFMECWRQKYKLIELRPDDRLFFAFSFGPFIGFWAAFEGACRQGYMCIPGGGLSTLRRLELIEQTAATILFCVPTYAMRMAEVAKQNRIDLARSSIRLIVVAGEPGGSIPAVRRRIELAWGARVIDHWGMTELGSLATEHIDDPGGLMVLETECIPEIVERGTFRPSPPGEVGELLITNLGRRGAPLFRYQTGDLVRAANSSSPTGLELLRLRGGILGRADQMITIRGNNVFPAGIEAILREIEGIAEYRIEVTTVREMQNLRLVIEPVPELEDDSELLRHVGSTLNDRLGFHVEVRGVAPGNLPRFEMKAQRFHRVEE